MNPYRVLLGLCLSAAMLAPGCGRNILPEVSKDPSQEAANDPNRKKQIAAEEVEAVGEMREWQSGEFTFRARFKEVKGSNVVLVTESGDVRTFPMSRLSPADQQYVRSKAGG